MRPFWTMSIQSWRRCESWGSPARVRVSRGSFARSKSDSAPAGQMQDLLAAVHHHAHFEQPLAAGVRRLLRREHRALVRLEPEDPVARRRGALEDGGPVEAAEAGGGRQAGEPEDRGRDVEVQGRSVDRRAGPDLPRPGEPEGDAQRRLVEIAAVPPVAVLAQALAMIGGEDEQGVGLELGVAVEGREQAPDVLVGEGDLGVVAVRPGDLAVQAGDAERTDELLLQAIGGVRLDVVDPEQERPAALLSVASRPARRGRRRSGPRRSPRP